MVSKSIKEIDTRIKKIEQTKDLEEKQYTKVFLVWNEAEKTDDSKVELFTVIPPKNKWKKI